MSIVWLRNGRPYGMEVQLGSVLSTAPGVPSGCSSCIFDQIAASVAPPMLMMRSAGDDHARAGTLYAEAAENYAQIGLVLCASRLADKRARLTPV